MTNEADKLIPNQCGCGKPVRYIVPGREGTTGSCNKYGRCSTREELQAEVVILRKGLEDIIQHQDIIGRQMSRHSTVRYIAHKALMESKDLSQ
jgi:hypothetical protein